MVELFPTRRRAEEFARALEGPAETTDVRLQELLDVTSRLAAVPLVQPRAQFRDSLRERLMEAAATELPAAGRAAVTGSVDPPSTGGPTALDDARAARRRRRLVAVATGLVLVGGGAGVAAASEQALPGDVLYPVKRTLENAQVSLAQGADGEGRALLRRAGTRLDEVEALSAEVPAGDGNLDGVEATLDDFAADAVSGGERLLASYDTTGDPADLVALRGFTAESHRALAGLADILPRQARPAVTAADEAVVTLDGMAKRACPGCTVAPPLTALSAGPVALPEVGADASPYVPTVDAPHRDRPDNGNRAADRERANHSPPQQPVTDDPAGALPDLDLDGPGGQQQTKQDATPGPGGGADAQQGPRLDLGDVVAPAPSPAPPQRTTDAPASGDLGDVTEPLTDPLQPLVDGSTDTLDETRSDLDDPL
jgi:hypothetical protein